jgi:RND family efflux transporter MFP subunit
MTSTGNTIKSSGYILLCTSILAALFLCAGCGKEPVEEEIIRPVKAVQIDTGTSRTIPPYPGRAAATEEVDLGFELSGTVIDRPVNKGDEVQKGQLLAKLDPRDFQNDLKASQAERDRAKAYYDRINIAVKSGAVSKQELTDAQARLDVSSAKVRIKQKQLADSEIIAPFDGIIAATYAENYQRVQPKQIVLRLLDISKIEFTINIPETIISYVRQAPEMWLVFDAFPDKKIPATIKEVGTEASLTTRTYPVTVIMNQPADIQILPGMAGFVSGEKDEPAHFGRRGITVPVGAVFTPDTEKESYAWIVETSTMTVHRRSVKTGAFLANGIVVQEGISPGDWIVTAGLHTLTEGQQVTIFGESAQEAGK